MARHSPQLLELARRGAELQLRDLVQEIRYLIDLFPHLQDSFNEDDLPLPFIIGRDAARTSRAGAERPGQRKGRPAGSGRKKVGARTKRDWPARRETKKA